MATINRLSSHDAFVKAYHMTSIEELRFVKADPLYYIYEEIGKLQMIVDLRFEQLLQSNSGNSIDAIQSVRKSILEQLERYKDKFARISESGEPLEMQEAAATSARQLSFISKFFEVEQSKPSFEHFYGIYEALLERLVSALEKIKQTISVFYVTDISLNSLSIAHLAENSFDGIFEHLKVLYLNANKLTSLEHGQMCSMPLLERLELAFNSIERVEARFFSVFAQRLKHLNLAGNHLTHLHRDMLGSLNCLETLNLSSNGLERIDNKAFQDLVNLHTLDLSANKIKSSNNDYFRTLTKLKKLYLSENELTLPINESFWSGLCQLEELYVRRNNLCGKMPKLSAQLTSLTRLFLSENKLTCLEEGAFDAVSQTLTEIYLNENLLETLSVNSFFTSDKNCLLELYLKDNRLETMRTENCFKWLKKLKRLSLSCNSMKELNDQALNGLTQLEYLSLSRNNLSELHANSFKTLMELRELDLSANELRSFDVQALLTPCKSSLRQLVLTANHLKEEQIDLSFVNTDMLCLKRLQVVNNRFLIKLD